MTDICADMIQDMPVFASSGPVAEAHNVRHTENENPVERHEDLLGVQLHGKLDGEEGARRAFAGDFLEKFERLPVLDHVTRLHVRVLQERVEDEPAPDQVYAQKHGRTQDRLGSAYTHVAFSCRSVSPSVRKRSPTLC